METSKRSEPATTGSAVVRIIRDLDLEPAWNVKQAKEPGFMRSLTSWVGGPDGYLNENPGQAAISDRCAVGLMRMPVGNRQAGVHFHSVTEIYVILKGQVESFDGVGNIHRAGPLDCLYIPAGVPHAVRTIGNEDLELIWVHDALEKTGTSVYLDGPGPFPADDTVSLIPFLDLEPCWDEPRAKEAGFLRWFVNWVGGRDGYVNFNPAHAMPGDRIGMGIMSLLPGNTEMRHSHPDAEVNIVLSGKVATHLDGRTRELHPLDALYCPAGAVHAMRNHGDVPATVLWVSEAPRKIVPGR